MHKSLWNIRHEDKPILPKSRCDILLNSDLYVNTNDGDLFLLYDVNESARRIIGFCSPTCLEIL